MRKKQYLVETSYYSMQSNACKLKQTTPMTRIHIPFLNGTASSSYPLRPTGSYIKQKIAGGRLGSATTHTGTLSFIFFLFLCLFLICFLLLLFVLFFFLACFYCLFVLDLLLDSVHCFFLFVTVFFRPRRKPSNAIFRSCLIVLVFVYHVS